MYDQLDICSLFYLTLILFNLCDNNVDKLKEKMSSDFYASIECGVTFSVQHEKSYLNHILNCYKFMGGL